jgi:DNA-directed RNA polymerase subunit RPC12/RpoP
VRKCQCPKCGYTLFSRSVIEEVEVIVSGETLEDNVIGGGEEYHYRCAKCGTEVDEDKLDKLAEPNRQL